MATYTAGLASGLDWTSMISSIMQVERQPITTLETKKTEIQEKQSAWSTLNTKLSSLETAAAALSDLEDFDVYTSSTTISGSSDNSVSDLASFAVGSTASAGSYSVTINSLATAQKLSSAGFSSTSTALGLEGDFLINGQLVSLTSTDTLKTLQSKINATNTGTDASGVTASIVTASNGEYRLTITAEDTGEDGIDIANASSADILGDLGIVDKTTSLAHSITGGAQSREFSSSTQTIGSLLELSSAASGTVTIGGQSVAIDLSSDSLSTIATKLTNAGLNATVVSDSSSGTTTYTLQIDGTQSFSDSNNILQTLGVLERGLSDVSGLTGSTENTVNGKAITATSLLSEIDGYNSFTEGDTITIGGTLHDGSALADTTFTITDTSTVDDLLSAIEAAYGGNVSASINADGAIVLEDGLSGTSSLSLNLTSSISDGSLTFGTEGATLTTLRKRELVAGKDAEITVDGETITRSSNLITDVIEGVSISLVGADEDAEINLTISRDTDSIKTLIDNFVSAYNDVMDYVDEQSTITTEDDGTVTTPTLYADSSLMTIKSEVRSNILASVSGTSSGYDHLSLIGIEIDEEGELSVDDDVLSDALETNFDDVVSLFATRGSSSNSSLTYVSSGNDTASGSYDVEITQIATQASLTGAGKDPITKLTSDSTITITDAVGNEAVVSLKAGWGMSSIVNAINSELSQNYNEVIVGENKLYADSSQTTAITSDTTWNSIYTASGTSAGLSDANVITFTGTDRDGGKISGSYTISDITSDNVGDLLSSIEDSFGDGYDAYIDSEGRIAIKDNTTGDSELTLSIGTTGSLDFGDIDVDSTGADGSHEGRYSLDITAENASGYLKIYNNDYGSYSLTVSASGTDELGLNSGKSVAGQDVAGRIRESGSSTWQTMTGKGQTLTGDDDQDVEDLVIKYTGTTTGTYDFDLTSGAAAKMNRSVYYMTDSVSGYVTGKQKNFTNQIASLDKRIDNLESRMEIRQNTLYNQFIAMETLLSKLQAQQSYLSSLTSSKS